MDLMTNTYPSMAVFSLAVAVDAVVSLRRDSCRLLETPLSLLKDELDLLTLWLLEKLLLEVSYRLLLNMMAAFWATGSMILLNGARVSRSMGVIDDLR